MKIITDIDEMRDFSLAHKRTGKLIGLVPTMGYLHKGHLSLIEIAKKNSDIIIASIYVNPKQFSENEDFSTYPRDIKRDHELLKEIGCHVAFEPKSLYNISSDDSNEIIKKIGIKSDSYQTYVTVEQLQEPLCGHSRPHFFRGVATVVTKLFNIIMPDVAIFGLKDYQQFLIIQKMTLELNFPIKIIGGPIYREFDGLAMSSRNARLSLESRKKCKIIYESLLWAEKEIKLNYENLKLLDIKLKISENIEMNDGIVDYVEIADASNLKSLDNFKLNQDIIVAIAAFFDDKSCKKSVRLIDNNIFKI